jgi:hypothetical protein
LLGTAVVVNENRSHWALSFLKAVDEQGPQQSYSALKTPSKTLRHWRWLRGTGLVCERWRDTTPGGFLGLDFKHCGISPFCDILQPARPKAGVMAEDAENIFRENSKLNILEYRVKALEETCMSLVVTVSSLERQVIASRCNSIVRDVCTYLQNHQALIQLPLPPPPGLPDWSGYNEKSRQRQAYDRLIAHVMATYARLTGVLLNSDNPLSDAREWYRGIYDELARHGQSDVLAQLGKEGFPMMATVEEEDSSL